MIICKQKDKTEEEQRKGELRTSHVSQSELK